MTSPAAGSPQTMLAIGYTQNGAAADVLKQLTVQKPTPGKRQLLVRVHAMSTNPVDGKLRKGAATAAAPSSTAATAVCRRAGERIPATRLSCPDCRWTRCRGCCGGGWCRMQALSRRRSNVLLQPTHVSLACSRVARSKFRLQRSRRVGAVHTGGRAHGWQEARDPVHVRAVIHLRCELIRKGCAGRKRRACRCAR